MCIWSMLSADIRALALVSKSLPVTIGTTRSAGITAPSAKYGGAISFGLKSMYCSPAAERFSTLIGLLAGTGCARSRSIETASPVAVVWIPVTRPTLMPRIVTSDVGIRPPEVLSSSVSRVTCFVGLISSTPTAM